MNLVTLNEVNLVACGDNDGCCSYPLCAPPIIECQRVFYQGGVTGYQPSPPTSIYYHVRRIDSPGGGFQQSAYANILNVNIGLRNVLESGPIVFTESGIIGFPTTTTLSGPMTREAAREAIVAKAKESVTDADYTTTTECETTLNYSDDSLSGFLHRYRVKIPAGYEDRSTYKLQWEVVFITKEWAAWKIKIDAYNLQKKHHDLWEQQDPETRGAEPYVIPDPGEEPTKPVSLEKKDWNYTGTDFSDWFVMAPPPAPGKCVIANMLVVCYKSARTGVKPTSTGPVYEVEET